MSTPPEQIRRARTAAGLTQDDLATRAGVTAKTVYRMERGERIRPTNERAIHDALGLPYAQPVEEPTAEPAFARPQLVGNPDLYATHDTMRMCIALKDELAVEILARVDTDAWLAALGALPLWQRARVGGNHRLFLAFGLMAAFDAILALASLGLTVYSLWAGEPTATVLCFGVVAVLCGLSAFLLWALALAHIEEGVRKAPFGVALSPSVLLLLEVVDDVVNITRYRLLDLTVEGRRHGAFVSYRITMDTGTENARSAQIPGLPYDADLHRMITAGQRGDRARSLRITLPSPQIA